MSLIQQINQVHYGAAKVVVFDIGGVLIRIHRSWDDALQAAGFRNGVRAGLDDAPGIHEFQRGLIDQDEYLEGLKDFLRLESKEEALAVHYKILREPYPDTLELVEELNDRGILTACLSNTNAPHWCEMLGGRYPNIQALQVHAVSQVLKLQKPDPAIFQAFEDLTGRLPAGIVYFDDLEENVEAARDQGWRAYWIDHSAETADQMELILISEGVIPPP